MQCATCGGDFIRSKQLRKYCEPCQVKQRGEAVPRKCQQCDNMYTDFNTRRKLCYTCRKQGAIATAAVVNSAEAINRGLAVANPPGSFSANLAQSPQVGISPPDALPVPAQPQSGAMETTAPQLVAEVANPTPVLPQTVEPPAQPEMVCLLELNCSQCGVLFQPSEASRTICGSCDQKLQTGISTKSCAGCGVAFTTTDAMATHCVVCNRQSTLQQCPECQAEFLPSSTSDGNRCDACCSKSKETFYSQCEKCSSTQNDGKRLCGNCKEPKKDAATKKCAGCDVLMANTPRKFCETCRVENEKPQVSLKFLYTSETNICRGY